MRASLRWFLTGFSLLVVLMGACWLALHRQDISYDDLEDRYQLDASAYERLPNGLLVHYVERGPQTGPPVLLLHGLGMSLETWGVWQDELAQAGYRAISVDLPAHGLTRVLETTDLSTSGLVSFVDAFADRLGLTDMVVIGSSLGGQIAFEYALDHSENVAGLVLVAPAGLAAGPSLSDEGSVPQNSFARAILASLDPTSRVRDSLQRAYFDSASASEDLITQYSDFARAPGHRAALLRIMSRSDGPTSDALARAGQISAPVLIIQGEADQIVPAQQARDLFASTAGAQLILMPETGHLPQEERSEESFGYVREFLTSLQTETPQPETAGPESVPAEN